MKPQALFVPVLLAAAARGDVAMRVDPRIELLTVVQLLSGSQRLNALQQPYRTNILSFFSPYRDHLAVRLSADLERAGFSFDAPPTMMLHLSDPPDLAIRVPYTPYLVQRAGGRDRIDAFVTALREFARVSRFNDFYEANRGMFTAVETATRSRLDDLDYTGKLEQYHGQKKDSYTIVLGLLLHPGGYGPAVDKDVYNLIGPAGVVNGMADFGTLGRLRDLMWHEFGHSFANPLVEQHFAYINRFASLLAPIEQDMRSQAYSNWQSTMNEHFVRAIHVRLTCRELGEEACQERYAYERGRGFAYLDALIAKLKEYEENRERFPASTDFGQRFFEGLEAEQATLTSILQDTTGRIAIRAPRATVKQRLYVLAAANGGVLVRESADESVYGTPGSPETGSFRYEVRGDATVVAIEPNLPEVRQVLIALKYAAEMDPEMKGSFGLVASQINPGRLRVDYVREASRASAMGFRIGDVLLDWATLYRFPLDAVQLSRLRDLPDDATATVRVVRNGDPVELQITGSMR